MIMSIPTNDDTELFKSIKIWFINGVDKPNFRVSSPPPLPTDAAPQFLQKLTLFTHLFKSIESFSLLIVLPWFLRLNEGHD